MKEKKIFLAEITPEELKVMISEAVGAQFEKHSRPDKAAPEEEFLTRRQVSKLLQVSLPKLDSLLKGDGKEPGELPFFRIGKGTQIRILRSDLTAFIKALPTIKHRRGGRL